MSRFMRFFSKRYTNRRSTNTYSKQNRNKNIIVCQVILLDGTDISLDLPVSSILIYLLL